MVSNQYNIENIS